MRSLLVALLTIFVDILGFGIIIPVQPFYAESFGADPTTVTLLAATYSLMQFVFAPMWGRLSDRIGRRPVILTSVAVSVVGTVIFALAGSLLWLFIGRIIVGVGTANFGAAQAVVADTTSGRERARGMGLLGAAFGFGFILGPAIGGGLSQISAAAPFWFSAGLALVNLFFAWRFLPETLPPERRGPRPGRWLALAEMRGASKYINVPQLLAIIALSITGMGLMEQALGLLIEGVWVLPAHGGIPSPEVHRISAGMTALPLIVVGVTSVIIQGGLLGRLTKRFGERRLVQVGAAVATLGLLLIPLMALAESFPLFCIVGGGVLSIGTATMMPSTNAFLSRSVPAEDQGRWLGIGQSVSALGRTIGPALSGALFATADLLPFFAAAALMGIAALVSLTLAPLQEHARDPSHS